MALRQAALVLAAASTACETETLRMQTFTDCLQLPFLGQNSAVGDCPTLYSTDRDTYLVQGWKIFANGRLIQLDIPAGHTAVEVRRSCSSSSRRTG